MVVIFTVVRQRIRITDKGLSAMRSSIVFIYGQGIIIRPHLVGKLEIGIIMFVKINEIHHKSHSDIQCPGLVPLSVVYLSAAGYYGRHQGNFPRRKAMAHFCRCNAIIHTYGLLPVSHVLKLGVGFSCKGNYNGRYY